MGSWGFTKDLQTESSRTLESAVRSVLACPRCGGSLQLSGPDTQAVCQQCSAVWPIEDGILHFMDKGMPAQEAECRLRENVMKSHGRQRAEILEVVGKHHCMSVMSARARQFRSSFHSDKWVLDIGSGTGWYWSGTVGAGLILTDFSRESLRVSRHLLADADRAVFLWADAQKLPLRKNVISGLWSIQVFQHFPAAVLENVQAELDRVLRDEFLIEVYNLNPAPFHRAIYRLFGKQLHCRGRLGEMELNRLSAEEWSAVWRQFRRGAWPITSGYSELFFHPDFHLWPRWYPTRLEQALITHAPGLAGLFARQLQIRIDARASE